MKITSNLTNEQINVQIAENIMGYRKNDKGWNLGKLGSGTVYGELPDYAGNRANADLATDKILKDFPAEVYPRFLEEVGFEAKIAQYGKLEDELANKSAREICLALLRAIGST
jgi:hypothetical protein